MLKHTKKKERENSGNVGDDSKLDSHSEVHGSSSHAPRVLNDLESLNTEERPTDFVVIFEDGVFHVHRCVLAASSKYFKAMFQWDTIKKTGRVKIDGVKLRAGKLCLDYMYKGKVEIAREDPESLVFASELMQLRPLTNIYFEFWKKRIGIQDCQRYLELAERYKHPSREEFFKNLSATKFLDIMRNNGIQGSSFRIFLRYMKCLLKLAPEILKASNIDIEVWRRASPELLLFISFGCSTDDFLREIQSRPLVCKNQELKDAVVRLGEGYLLKRKNRSKNPKYIVASHYTFGTLHALNVATNKWTRCVKIPADVLAGPSCCDMVSVRGNIYVTSHKGLGMFKKGGFVLLSENRFFARPHCCIVRNDVIYIIEQEMVSKYNTRINTWTEVRVELPLDEDFFVTSSNEHIYAMGGQNTEYNAFRFAFDIERWERIKDMQEGKYAGAAFWYNSKVYATGNRDHPTRIECYTPESNKWTFIDWDFSCKRSDFKAFVIKSEIYFVGFEEVAHPIDGDDTRYAIAVIDLQKKKTRFIDGMWIDSRMSCAIY